MLPQGIFIIPTISASSESMHSSWEADLQSYGPWSDAGAGVPLGWRQGTSSSKTPIVVTETCTTTMELARQLAADGLLGPWGAVCSALQSGGRGQLRRPWASLPGNLHASILLPPPPAAGKWAEALPDLLPLVVAHVFAVVLEGFGATLEIKWPNDILQDGKKVGGILIEERNNVSIVGLGLNLTDCPAEAQLREDHSVSAAKIAMPFFSGGAVRLLEHLVNRGEKVYEKMLNEIPPTRLIAMVESKLAWFGRTIVVREGDAISYESVLSGLSPRGGLVLRRGNKETVLYSGSIFPL